MINMLICGHFGGNQQIWSKMVSSRHCQLLLPLFGINTIEQLKDMVSRNVPDRGVKYNGTYMFAPVITWSISLDKIATLP